MSERCSWEDLRLFLSVARGGGLARAAAGTLVSAPTLGRRMTTLERMLGVGLFLRRRDGYRLTAAGKELLVLAESVEKEALKVERWRAAENPQPMVTIAAGAWTSVFIARHLDALMAESDGISLRILSDTESADLLRRQANLGLRNQRPTTPGLAGQRLVKVAFAVYGETNLVSNSPVASGEGRFGGCDWVAFAPAGPKTPSLAWLEQKLAGEARLTCSTTQALLEALLSGLGLCILPCFIGDQEPRLTRASEPIAELAHYQWLVSHDDDRHSKPIRQVANKLAKLVRGQAPLFAGEHGG